MIPLYKTLTAAALLAAAATVHAQDIAAPGDLHITSAHARATTAGVQNSAAWLGIRNDGDAADRLVNASSPVAKTTEIHDMKLEGDVMRMFRVEGVDIPAHGSLQMGDGNKVHIMLLGLHQPLQEGQNIPLSVTFEKAGTVEMQVPVRAITQPAKEHGKEHGKPPAAAMDKMPAAPGHAQ